MAIIVAGSLKIEPGYREEFIKRSIDIGAIDFIVKPFTREDLLATLQAAMK